MHLSLAGTESEHPCDAAVDVSACTEQRYEWLPEWSSPGGRAGAAAALLGNLLEVTHTALQDTASAGQGCLWAERVCSVFLTLLDVLPLRVVFPAGVLSCPSLLPVIPHGGHRCPLALPYRKG
jgi:hypothetical protein